MVALRTLALGTPMQAHGLESGLGQSTAQAFVPEFFAWFVEFYFDTWVARPMDPDTLEAMERPFAKCGLPGCIASMDGVHVAWDRCPATLAGRSTGWKGYTSLAFNV